MSQETVSWPSEEQSFELHDTQKGVMEKFQEERLVILKNFITPKILESAALLAPGIDIATLFAAATHGETLTGKELDAWQRGRQFAMSVFLTAFYVLHFSGMHKEAWAARGATFALGAVEFGPEMVRDTIQMAKEKAPGLVNFLEASANFITDNPDLISLNLNS